MASRRDLEDLAGDFVFQGRVCTGSLCEDYGKHSASRKTVHNQAFIYIDVVSGGVFDNLKSEDIVLVR